MCNTAPIDTKYTTTGVDADLLILTTLSNNPGESFVAWAVYCYQDPKNLRPLIGQVNFNLNYLDTKDSNYDMTVKTVIHELTHVLAFSSSLYSSFLDANGKKYDFNSMIKKTTSKKGVAGTAMNTPNLVALAKKHFNCATLDSVALENDGSAGSAGSHFERMLLFNEVMTAS